MRFFYPTLFCILLFSKAWSQEIFYPELKNLFDAKAAPFYFGVASGDPVEDGVVIWTKIYTESTSNQQVEWVIATDTFLLNVVKSGIVETDFSSAFTVKVNVDGLAPGTTYFYRFKHETNYSPTGRTRTAKSGNPELLRFAVVSCADYQSGYYNAFEHIAKRTDLDAVIHLGDYIYEYGVWRRGRKRMVKNQIRQHIPDKVCSTLEDYRTRYGQYRLDPQLKEAHRLHPFIVIWDDHEIANNANASGAGIGGSSNGEWMQRKTDARQAYFEWLPIRENPDRSIIRKFSFGNLADLWMLDERLEARSPQAKGINDPELGSLERYMLGETQKEWLLNGIKNSTASWKIIGNQVIFSPLNDSRVFSRTPAIGMDRWDGYPAERRQIFDFFYENNLNNIVVITGDVHTSWAFELTGDPSNPEVYDCKTGKGVIGAEFTTPSITSFNFDEVVPKFITWEAKRRFKKKKNNPHLRYLDLNHHGYMALTLTPERAQADWFFIKRKDRIDSRVKKKGTRYLEFNGHSLVKK
jgi:alkaline phosphatase D